MYSRRWRRRCARPAAGPGARRAVEHVGVQAGENLDERGRGRGGEALQARASPAGREADAGSALGRTRRSRSRHGPASFAATAITMVATDSAARACCGNRAHHEDTPTGFAVDERSSRVAFASPLWGIVEAAKLLARVAGQRGLPWGKVAGVGSGKAAGSAPHALRRRFLHCRPRAGEGCAPAKRGSQDEEPRVVGNPAKLLLGQPPASGRGP